MSTVLVESVKDIGVIGYSNWSALLQVMSPRSDDYKLQQLVSPVTRYGSTIRRL